MDQDASVDVPDDVFYDALHVVLVDVPDDVLRTLHSDVLRYVFEVVRADVCSDVRNDLLVLRHFGHFMDMT